MIRPIAIAEAHMECRFLKETVPALTGLLAFEQVADGPRFAALKHPNTPLSLIVHEAGPDAPAKQMYNHYGVRVAERQEVDAACEYLTIHSEEYGLPEIGKPAYSHGSYSLYFREPGTNGWELECYQDALRKDAPEMRMGGVRVPHWDRPLSPERFPGCGYMPQAFTHGTLSCDDIAVSREFYARVLGLEVIRFREQVVYIKHPDSRWYIVCLGRADRKRYSPNFRFTLAVESPQAVEEAHRQLALSSASLGVTELGELRTDGNGASFLLSDPDRNWWEVRGPEE